MSLQKDFAHETRLWTRSILWLWSKKTEWSSQWMMTHSTSWHQSPVVTDYDSVLTLRMMMTWREARSRHATCIHHCTCPGGQKYGQSAIIDVTAAEGSGNGGKFRILRSILLIAGCLFICLHRCPHHNMSRCEYKYYLLNTLINRKYLKLLWIF